MPAKPETFSQTLTPFLPQPADQPTSKVEPTFPPIKSWTIWVDPLLPVKARESLVVSSSVKILDPGSPEGSSQADLRLAVDPAANNGQSGQRQLVSRWIYALAAPFPTLTDDVTSESLRQAWSGNNKGSFAGQPILVDESTWRCFSALWGEPNPQAVLVLPADQLIDYAWAHQPAWAIVPFEAVEPRWKVLEVDGISPLHKEFDPQNYALTLPIFLMGSETALKAALNSEASSLPMLRISATNRNPDRLTILVMTGTTALVRATAYTMEQKGVTYPDGDIRDWLRNADLTHVSNEAPFAKNCPYPDPNQTSMRFCSDPRYIALLEDIGTDIVELTGDHVLDWGSDAMLYTLDLYRQRNWLYYGGGANLEEGRRPITVENHGNRLAFIGCNAKGDGFAQAAPDHPGSVKCDLDWMSAQVTQLRQAGYIPIVTFQHFEYYTYQAQSLQVRDFGRLAEAGAAIVSGSQAHQPQGFEFKAGAFIHYGLGNLFFDQYTVSKACRQVFIDRHVFYEGRYIGAELLTAIFIDFAKPRPMNASERQDLLKTVFSASGW